MARAGGFAASLARRFASPQGWLLAASFSVGAVGGLGGPWAGRNYAIALDQLSPGTPFESELAIAAIAAVFTLGPLLWPALFARLLPAAIHLGALGLIVAIRQSYVSGPNGLTALALAVWLSVAASLPFLIKRRNDHSDVTP